MLFFIWNQSKTKQTCVHRTVSLVDANITWMVVSQEGFVIGLDVAVEVRTPLASRVFMLAGRYQLTGSNRAELEPPTHQVPSGPA